MKNINLIITLFVFLFMPSLSLRAETFSEMVYTDSVVFANTLSVESNDSPAMIVEKAAHVIPTPNQMMALRDEFIAFIHFGINTFTCKEWGDGLESPSLFELKQLDTDQWCKALKAAGIRKVILTVKHHDGFVLWQSRYTTHGIMSTDFQGGKGDVLRDLSESCRKYGLKLGVYLSPADLYQIESPDGLYGNQSQYTRRIIPREIKDRPFANRTTFEFWVDDYNEYFLNQLFEILTEYGPIHEVWFDGAHPKTKGGQRYAYAAWKELIHALAPDAVIFGREDIRWCGNEAGATRDSEWNVIAYQNNPDTMTVFPDLVAEDLGSRAALAQGKFLHYQPAEVNTSIREGWFYRDDIYQKVRGADDVFDIYERAVGGNSIFLLNVPPNREGLFSQTDVEVLEEVGRRIRETYGTNLLHGAEGCKEVLDGDADTYCVLQGDHKEIQISLPTPIRMNRLVLQEAVAYQGERVERHEVDAWLEGRWQKIAETSNIGYKRILRFPEVTTKKIRVRVLESRSSPAISHISAHYYPARPPRLAYSQDSLGLVCLFPCIQDFEWKSHGENASQNLNAGYQIFYTTDGSRPSTESELYKGPFRMDGGKLKAVAWLHGESGEMLDEQMGYLSGEWNFNAGSAIEGHPVELAFDGNPATYWNSPGDYCLTIDLKRRRELHGFAYTPASSLPNQGMRYGIVLGSNDGKQWTELHSFDFGNLQNDPSRRLCHFAEIATVRFVKIQFLPGKVAGNIAVGELELF